MPKGYTNINIFVLAPGAFFVLAVLTAVQNYIKKKAAAKARDVSKVGSGCSEDCLNCGDTGCSRRFYDADGSTENPNLVNDLKQAGTETGKPEQADAEQAVTETEAGEEGLKDE